MTERSSSEDVWGLFGESAGMQRVRRLIERVAPSSTSVLIRGESGTGKELVARAVHTRSRRAAGPFVPVNCAAVPEQLLESELFGHRRGAFTGADEARVGLFREADGGTLFLDEIGEMSARLQPKLLRALQEQVVRPVGGDREVPVDVRVIAATHQDIPRAIEAGRFRADLFYRLDVIGIDVPPLRARGDDVLRLAERFLAAICAREGTARRLEPSALEALMLYGWPGNVRELRNAVEYAVMMSDEVIGPADLPPAIGGGMLDEAPPASGYLTLDEVERRHILRVYTAVGENKSEAARVLGIDRKTLHGKLARYGHA